MPSTATQTIMLPGDEVPSSDLPVPTSTSAALKLGPGLSHKAPSTISANVAGTLYTDPRKNAIWVENNTGRYLPHPNDLILATVQRSSAEAFMCTITPHSATALLPHLAFENVTKKSRPSLVPGSLVYARVTSSLAHNKFQDPELVCYNPSTGKSDGLGEVKGGMVYDISLEMARRLLVSKPKEDGGLVVLEVLAKLWPFEVAVGRNGRVWVDASDVKRTLLVGRCLMETDAQGLSLEGQEKLVRKLGREIGVE